MARSLACLALVAAAAAVAGCARQIDYASRVGRPSVERTVLSEADSGSGAVRIEWRYPPFPADGREVACRVEKVTGDYEAVRQAAAATLPPGPPSATVHLSASDVPPAAGPSRYALRIVGGEPSLPPAPQPGDSLTLRFLADGTFFDVRQW